MFAFQVREVLQTILEYFSSAKGQGVLCSRKP
jgi:hypothetical protein